MTYPEPTYTCLGPVSGCCGIRHRTKSAAERCVNRHWRSCADQGGYGERVVVPADELEPPRRLSDEPEAAADLERRYADSLQTLRRLGHFP